MDYKEKYEQALEKARELMDKGYDVLMPEIFPELQESEDEKVRLEIRNFIWEYPDKLPERTRWLAWFEKQEKKNINHNIDIKEKAHQIAWETSKDCDPLLSRESWCEMAALDMASRLEKQGEQKPTENAKKLDANKVIKWLNDQACLGWLEDVEVEKVVEQFKKDFGL